MRIGAFNCPKGRWCGEQNLHFMVLNDPPENTSIRRANGLALKQHGGASGQQRRVDNVGMTNDPTDIRRRPINIARLHIIDIRHAPPKRHRMPAIIANDTLWLAGGAGGVEDIQRVSRL